MSQSRAKTIRISDHEGILEAGAELSTSALDRDPILKVLSSNIRGVLAGDEFHNTQGFRGHLTCMGEYARGEDGGGGPIAFDDLFRRISNHRAVLNDFVNISVILWGKKVVP